MVNFEGFPVETRPRNDWCIKFYPAIFTSVADGWSMVSVAAIPPSNSPPNYSKAFLFPTAISQAFRYEGGMSRRIPSPTVLATG